MSNLNYAQHIQNRRKTDLYLASAKIITAALLIYALTTNLMHALA